MAHVVSNHAILGGREDAQRQQQLRTVSKEEIASARGNGPDGRGELGRVHKGSLFGDQLALNRLLAQLALPGRLCIGKKAVELIVV